MLHLATWNLGNFKKYEQDDMMDFSRVSVGVITVSFCKGLPEPQIGDWRIQSHASYGITKTKEGVHEGLHVRRRERVYADNKDNNNPGGSSVRRPWATSVAGDRRMPTRRRHLRAPHTRTLL